MEPVSRRSIAMEIARDVSINPSLTMARCSRELDAVMMTEKIRRGSTVISPRASRYERSFISAPVTWPPRLQGTCPSGAAGGKQIRKFPEKYAFWPHMANRICPPKAAWAPEVNRERRVYRVKITSRFGLATGANGIRPGG